MKRWLPCLLLLTLACAARAEILWTWTNGGTGTEKGYIITDGYMDTDQVDPGTYTIIDFSVTETAYPLPIGAVSNGVYRINQPTVGFDWSGTEPTVFWRVSGTYVNGCAFVRDDTEPLEPNTINVGIGHFKIWEMYGVVYLDEAYTLVLTPVVTPVEETAFGRIKALYR